MNNDPTLLLKINTIKINIATSEFQNIYTITYTVNIQLIHLQHNILFTLIWIHEVKRKKDKQQQKVKSQF